VSNNEWLDIDVLEDYLDGKLDAKTMHKIERVSLEDPFVAQALAGLTESKKRKQSLSLLQKQLQERIAQKPVEKKLWTITSQRLSIAAAAAVLFITVSLFFFMRENSRQKEEQIANNKPKKVDVTIAPETAAVAMKVDTATTDKTKVEVEIDKAIANAKTNSYAKNNKKIKEQPLQDFVPVQAVPSSSMPSASQEISYQNKAEKEKSAILEAENRTQQKQVVSALRGRVAGVTINTPGNSTINGTVFSKDDGAPLPGVAIKIAGTNQTTQTNANGEFSIPIDSLTNQKLAVNYIGFKPTEVVNVKPNEKIKIELEPSNNSLSEVVVTSSNIKNNKTITTTSNPVIGWEDYHKYLKKNVDKTLLTNLTKPAPIVELSFTVDGNGMPANIKITRSGGKPFDTEAIRLLKNGSKWMYSPLAKNIGKLKIDFSLF
jgi:hypothetical protein